jgi:hypothetical protein
MVATRFISSFNLMNLLTSNNQHIRLIVTRCRDTPPPPMPTKKSSKGAGGSTKRRRMPPKIPGAVEIGPLPPMKPGEYYVGDLCYVLGKDAWKELQTLSEAKENTYGNQGNFRLANGRVLVIFNLANDGLYPDEQGHTFSVDSGTIGMTLTAGLETEYGEEDKKEDWDSEMNRLGAIIDYESSFSCMSINFDHPSVGSVSVLNFGEKVSVNTTDEMTGLGALLHGLNTAAKKAGAN